MSTKHAIYDVAEFKALPDDDGDEQGRFEALVSVFGNVDLQGDRVVEGAFEKSLDEWKAAGAPIPVIWSHNWGDPNAHIGYADPNDVVEVPGKGLKVPGTIDLDNPFAAQVYRLLKERRVREFSFGYQVRKEKKAKDGANELLELGLIEVGPTLKGANPSTELLAVKSQLEEAATEVDVVDVEDADADVKAEVPDAIRAYIDERLAATGSKAGRSISRKNESSLRAARDAIDQVLASLGAESADDDEGEATGKATPADANGKPTDEVASLKAKVNLI